MVKDLLILIIVSFLTSLATAESSVYSSSADEFDINSISSYLGGDISSAHNNKGIGYSYTNSYNRQSSTPDGHNGPSNHFTFGQKSPVNNAPTSSPYTHPPTNYNHAYGSGSYANVADYSGTSSATNTFGNSFDAYNGNPVALGTFSNRPYSPYSSSSSTVHGANPVSYAGTPLKSVPASHLNLQGWSGGATYAGSSSMAFPTSMLDSTSAHVANPYQDNEGSSFGGTHQFPSSSSISHQPPYQFEKSNQPGGPSHLISSYKGSSSLYNSFENGYTSKSPKLSSLNKGFSSGPPHHIISPTDLSSHFSGSINYKSPYYSDHKQGPGIYYTSNPSISPYSGGYKSSNSYESVGSSPYKYISDTPRYPRFPGKYISSRPGYSYSSRPHLYLSSSSPYRSYLSKPSSSYTSYAAPF